MRDEEIPRWLIEIGRRPKHRETGRPVPPISGTIRVDRELDEAKAAVLEREFASVIEDSTPDQEYELNQRILDAMTGNRLGSNQAYRLLLRLFTKNGHNSPGLSRVDSDGNLEPVSWSAI